MSDENWSEQVIFLHPQGHHFDYRLNNIFDLCEVFRKKNWIKDNMTLSACEEEEVMTLVGLTRAAASAGGWEWLWWVAVGGTPHTRHHSQAPALSLSHYHHYTTIRLTTNIYKNIDEITECDILPQWVPASGGAGVCSLQGVHLRGQQHAGGAASFSTTNSFKHFFPLFKKINPDLVEFLLTETL